MARGHEDKAGSAVADRIGLFTAILAIGGYVLAIVLAVKHPRTALIAMVAALVFTLICSSPMQSPLLGLVALCIGASLAKGM